MPVKDADPAAASLDVAFADAMGAPARPKEPPPPPETDPEAPHGRDDQGVPLEPFGRTKEGRIRLTRAGRPSREDRARTAPPAPTPPPAAKGTVVTVKADYSEGLGEAADAAWFCLAGLGEAGGKIPLVGKWIPESKLAGQAVIFRAEKQRLVASVNLAAQHNDKARRFAEKCSEGTVSWVLMCGFLALPFLAMSTAVWGGDSALKEREMPNLAELKQKNAADLDEFIAEMTAGLAEATEQSAAGLVDQTAAAA